MAREPATVTDRYQFGDYLGESRLGRTYRARDTAGGGDVEITFLAAEAVADPDAAAARLEELRNLRHLHVLPLLDWRLDPVPYLVYPAPPMRLQRLIESGAALTPSQTLIIGLQAAETLHSLRRSGLTHGAITPASCCVDVRGRLRLAEVGVDFLRRPRQVTETTRYDPPEVIREAESGTSAPGIEVGTTPPVVIPAVTADDETAGIPAIGVEDEPTPPAEPPAAGIAHRAESPVSGREPVAAPADSGQSRSEGGEAAVTVADPGESQVSAAAAAAADVFGLALVLAEAAAGQSVSPEAVGQLGRTVVPSGAGAVTTRNLTRLAPLLAQASVTRPASRLEADELALALRATAEMFPPPTRLEEAFQRAEDFEAEPAAPEAEEIAPAPKPKLGRTRSLVPSLATAVAIIVAGLGLVLLGAPDDDTPAHPVPGVVGLDWSTATETLTGAGWEVRRLDVRIAGVAPGEVVGQLPEAGGLLDEGQIVKVQVNLGEPPVVIPADIVGMTVTEAELRLSAIGLRLGRVQTLVDPTVTPGSVVAVAEPLPELPRGSTVDLVVADGG